MSTLSVSRAAAGAATSPAAIAAIIILRMHRTPISSPWHPSLTAGSRDG
ncbi:MAG: hypothetical protein ACT6QT_12740 [Sphingopyxis sp.]